MVRQALVLGVFASLLLSAASASAAVVGAQLVRDDWIAITLNAHRGEENQVTLRGNSARQLVLVDSGAPIAATGMCDLRDRHVAVCPSRRTVEAHVSLGTGDDRFRTDLGKQEGAFVTVLGGPGADLLSTAGSRFRSGIAAFGGVLNGGPGHDELVLSRIGGEGLGGSGNDRIMGGASVDRLLGGPGRDEVDGRGGGDRVKGEEGRDLLSGGSDPDVVVGGPGADRISGGAGDDGNGRANVWLSGGSGDDSVRGGNGDDRVLGGRGVDELDGESGNDWVSGGAGVDLLSGAAGSDSLVGVAGADHLGCGEGQDEAPLVRSSTPFVEDCEQVVFGFFDVDSAETLSFAAPPIFTGDGITYATVCGDFHRGCKFDLTLINTTDDTRETLASAEVDLPAGQADDQPVEVVVPLDEEASSLVRQGISLTTVVTHRTGERRGSFEARVPSS